MLHAVIRGYRPNACVRRNGASAHGQQQSEQEDSDDSTFQDPDGRGLCRRRDGRRAGPRRQDARRRSRRAASWSAASTPAWPASRRPTARASGPASTSTSAAPSPPPSWATPNKVKCVPLTAQQRFTALQSGEIDILSRNTTWTLTRDASLGLNFTGVTYYDGQGFMVPNKLKRQERQAAQGRDRLRAVGHHHREEPDRLLARQQPEPQAGRVREAGSRHRRLLLRPLRRSTRPTPRAWPRCAPRKRKNPDDHVILPDLISKEPLGPVGAPRRRRVVRDRQVGALRA